MTIAEEEKKLEARRLVLAEEPLFEPFACFLRIDTQGKNYLNSVDIAQFLRDNGELGWDKDCPCVIKYFDSNNDGKLSFTDFVQMVLPTTNSTLRTIATQRPNYSPTYHKLNSRIEATLTALVVGEIKLHNRCEPLKQDLFRGPEFSILEAFKSIDTDGSRSIGPDK